MNAVSLGLGFLALGACLTVNAADLDRAEVEKRLSNAEKTHPADLRRKDLTDLNLSGLDFKHADLWGSDLRRANLSNSDLSGLNLDLAVMTKTNLSGANLSHTSVFGVHLGGADLSKANLQHSRFISTLDRANLRQADLSHANWGVDMKNQPMGLMRASLNNADLSGANLSNGHFERALMRYTKLVGSNLQHTVLSGVDLSGADLSGADLTDADLSGTTLEGADFSGANLMGTHLPNAPEKLHLKGLDSIKNVDKAIFK